MPIFKMILRSGKLQASKQDMPRRQANKHYSEEQNQCIHGQIKCTEKELTLPLVDITIYKSQKRSTGNMDKGGPVATVHLDLQSTFVKVTHLRLLKNMNLLLNQRSSLSSWVKIRNKDQHEMSVFHRDFFFRFVHIHKRGDRYIMR